MKNTIDTKDFTTYQLENLEEKKRLAEELEKIGIASDKIRLVKDDNWNNSFLVIFTVEGKYYQLSQDYKGNKNISLYPHKYYKVDNYKQAEIRKEVYTSNKMKVLTYKKLLEKIAEENTYHARVQAIEDEASDKVAKFLEELKRYGDNIKYYKDIDTGRIKGGYMEKNEVMYDFEINDNGYIRQEVKLRSRIGENCLEAFDKLSDNKYNG